jgi:hypothetical protein
MSSTVQNAAQKTLQPASATDVELNCREEINLRNLLNYNFKVLIFLLLLILPVQTTSASDTIGSTEKMGQQFTLEAGDSIFVSVEVSSGALEISILDDENYNDFVAGDATYHKERKSDISTSKSFTYYADEQENIWVVFWTNNGESATFTHVIEINDASQAKASDMTTVIIIAVIGIVVIMFLNSRESKIPEFD